MGLQGSPLRVPLRGIEAVTRRFTKLKYHKVSLQWVLPIMLPPGLVYDYSRVL